MHKAITIVATNILLLMILLNATFIDAKLVIYDPRSTSIWKKDAINYITFGIEPDEGPVDPSTSVLPTLNWQVDVTTAQAGCGTNTTACATPNNVMFNIAKNVVVNTTMLGPPQVMFWIIPGTVSLDGQYFYIRFSNLANTFFTAYSPLFTITNVTTTATPRPVYTPITSLPFRLPALGRRHHPSQQSHHSKTLDSDRVNPINKLHDSHNDDFGIDHHVCNRGLLQPFTTWFRHQKTVWEVLKKKLNRKKQIMEIQ